MSRADALRSLIAIVEAGTVSVYDAEPWEAVLGYEITSPQEVARFTDSLDAVARLEAPLRERGWEGPNVAAPTRAEGEHGEWCARWHLPGSAGTILKCRGHGDAEPRARLIAVLRALLHEAEAAR